MSGASPDALGHLSEFSEPAVRAALQAAAPSLADLPIALDRTPIIGSPNWASGRAIVGEQAFAKFALSERTAVRIWREAQALDLLGNELDLPVPRLIAAGRAPVLSATALVAGGVPLDYETVAAAGQIGSRSSQIGSLPSWPVCTPSARSRLPVRGSAACRSSPSEAFIAPRTTCGRASCR